MSQVQILDVLRGASVACLAMAAEEQPYAVPMHVQLDAKGAEPIIRMETSPYSLKAAILHQNPRVCLLFSLQSGLWMDSVQLLGEASVEADEHAMRIIVQPEVLSGRRFFLEDT